MGTISSCRQLPHRPFVSHIDELQQLCDDADTVSLSDAHCVRILVGSTILITSKNPFVILKIVRWYTEQTDCVCFDVSTSSTATSNQCVYKVSLSNKNRNDDKSWTAQLIQYMHTTTSYELSCMTEASTPSIHPCFISFKYRTQAT
mmetsp:Transcript_26189/g.41522  ORF Transcript_26189/g.41522 Transcript_26189/m.41522 type:complete len:146 (-) Transcript_26189:509-946(-)